MTDPSQSNASRPSCSQFSPLVCSIYHARRVQAGQRTGLDGSFLLTTEDYSTRLAIGPIGSWPRVRLDRIAPRQRFIGQVFVAGASWFWLRRALQEKSRRLQTRDSRGLQSVCCSWFLGCGEADQSLDRRHSDHLRSQCAV